VLNTYSWSYNLFGKKRWVFYSDEVVNDIVFYQSPGSLVFVPSGLEHSVENIQDNTVSINCNFITQYNLSNVYEFLKKERHSLVEELNSFQCALIDEDGNDIIEMNLMRPSCGMNSKDFTDMLQWNGIDL
jgi:oxalate decarboxylase/phosphoglucose isomerase-like protein (cupin superfamily)